MTAVNIPDHIPPHLVRDFDWAYAEDADKYYLRLKTLHEGPDIFYTPHNGGHWMATRFADMAAILDNDNDFTTANGSGLPRNPYPLPLLESDAPIHTDYRNLIAPFFTNKYVGNLERNVRELSISLIEGFAHKGECEFMGEFAQQMPIIIVLSLLDVPPQDAKRLLPIGDNMARSESPAQLAEALGQLVAYVTTEVLPARRAQPGSDIFSALLRGNVENGRPLTEHELINLCCLLITAGLDTVASLLGFITLFLARNPGHRKQLLERPEGMKHAIEEMLRRHHIIHTSRDARRDMDYKGVHFKAGDIVFLPLTLAGLDEQRYPDPMTVDFNRADTKHLGFGRGMHQCIGAFLARTELRVFLTEWLKRIPDFELQPGAVPRVVPGKVCSMRSLPLRWKVK